MKKFAALLFAALMLVPPAAFAVTAEEWKADLDSQIILLKAAMPGLALDGDITVSPDGKNLQASIPSASATDRNGGVWKIPPLTLKADAAQKVVQSLQLIPQGQIDVRQGNGTSKISFSNAQLTSDTGKQLRLTIYDLKSAQTVNGDDSVLSASRAVVTYKTAINPNLPLIPMLLMLQQQLGKQPLLADAQLSGLDLQQGEKTMYADNLTAQLQLQPQAKSDLLTARNAITLNGFSMEPAAGLAALLPQKVDLVGTATNLPVSMLSNTTLKDRDAQRQAMTSADTKIDVDSFRAESASGVVIEGQGWMKPSLKSPTGLTSHTTFKIMNLQKALNYMQTNPQDFKEGLIGLVLLQGLAKQEKDQAVNFVLDVTPEGKIILNGRDFAPIMDAMNQAKAASVPAPPPQ